VSPFEAAPERGAAAHPPRCRPKRGRSASPADPGAALHLDCAEYRIDDARKFCQYAVTGRPDDSAVVLGNLGIDEDAAVRHESFECFLLVPAHQPRISRDIGGEDGG
jgi:hypothetical protein